MSDGRVKIQYDDQEIEIIDKINKGLHEYGATRGNECVQLVDDGEEHDGFIILNIESRLVTEPPVRFG